MPEFNLLNLFIFHLIFIHISFTALAIRRDIGLQVHACRNTVQGRYLLADDKGYVCDALSVDPESRCCFQKGEQYSCQGCNLISQCCNSYELCVSCCLNPLQTQKELAVKVKISKAETAGTYNSVFDFCTGRCRHNSESVVHENAYLSDFHHCFSLPTNSSGSSDTLMESRLAGISVVLGRQGESCNSVCKLSGQSCVPSRLSVLNECKIMQRYMNCKRGCIASMGPDQPAEVVDGAPKHLYPGACLYSKSQTAFNCDGLHQHTRRLCPCA
ncbi:uncharacterized protein LOC104888789 isoform X2 [Beta vulgaris subsp. vulgaris]|uniref:uncharacterized protein LOC104888789 isoform X2 n=1 Tax=Beta vulgaris subsp. vulgaris TaxID=3555 RepID=UPI0020374A41|nr:uncharacterized protein LOC104888789 isoform X2 [Beta vulgaris subsp. vulgaris]